MSDSDLSDSELGEKLDERLQQMEGQTVVDAEGDLGDHEALARVVEDLHLAAALFEKQPIEGQQFGKFIVEKVIGRGGQSTTLLAQDPDLQRNVVLKVYRRLDSIAQQEAILQEGRLLCKVDSPYVVQCHSAELEVADASSGVDEAGESNAPVIARPYLVLKYVEGTPLDARLRLGSMEGSEILRIINDLSVGMQATHDQGVCHRDVKPGNIVLAADGSPVLIDFGLAVGHSESVAEPRSGTAAYMSPEQARGIGVDARSDIFGLGAVMYHMLTGFPPYRAEYPADTIKVAQRGEIEAPEKLNPNVDPRLAAVCMRCLAFDPDERFQEPAEIATALEAQGPRRRVLWLGGATTALIGCVLAAVFAIGSSTKDIPVELAPEVSLQVEGGQKDESGVFRFYDSDEISLNVSTNQAGYVYVFSIEGQKYRQLYPNAIQPLRMLQPRESLVVPQPEVARINLAPSTETELFRVVFTKQPWIGFSVVENTRGETIFDQVQPDSDWMESTSKIRASIERGATRSAELELVALEGRSEEILDEEFVPFRVESSIRKRMVEHMNRRKQQMLDRDPEITERLAWAGRPFSRRIDDLQIFDNRGANVPEIAAMIRAIANKNWDRCADSAVKLSGRVQATLGQVHHGSSQDIDLLRFCGDVLDSSGRSERAIELRKKTLELSKKTMLERSQRIELADELKRSQLLAEDKSALKMWQEADFEFAKFLLEVNELGTEACERVDRCLALREEVLGENKALLEPLFWRSAWLCENRGLATAKKDMERAFAIADKGYEFQFNRFANLWNRFRDTAQSPPTPALLQGSVAQASLVPASKLPHSKTPHSKALRSRAPATVKGSDAEYPWKPQKAAVYAFASANTNGIQGNLTDRGSSSFFGSQASLLADMTAMQNQTFQLFEIRRKVQQVRLDAWQGNIEKALRDGLKTRKLILDFRGDNNLELCRLDQQLAGLYREQGNTAECQRLLRSAWTSASSALRKAIEADTSVVTYLSTFTWQLYSELLATLDLSDPSQVQFAYQALCDSRALWDWSRTVRRNGSGDLGSRHAQRAESLDFVSMMPSLRMPDHADSGNGTAKEVDLRAEDAGYNRSHSEETLRELEKLLPQDMVIVEFVETRSATIPLAPFSKSSKPHYGVFLISKVDEKLAIRWTELGDAGEIEEVIQQWQDDLEDQSLADAVASRVWRPLETHFESRKRVAIVPYRGLARVPWGLLPTREGRDAIERYVLSCTHSAQEVIGSVAKADQNFVGDLLAIGGLDYGKSVLDFPTESRSAAVGVIGAKWQELPQALEEVEEISENFAEDRVRLIVADAARQDSLFELMPNRRVIHFATHAYLEQARIAPMFDRNLPSAQRRKQESYPKWQSPDLARVGLVLSGANSATDNNDSDCILTGSEIADLDLGCVDLVVLSACESGLGKQYAGEGPIGLQRAFHFAGARSVIACLWKVDDKSARLLMRRFYENLEIRGMSKAEALRAAQIAMRNGELTGGVPQPAKAWAGWILSGRDQ